MHDVKVGRFLRSCRLRLGWRQVDLAAKAGVSQQEISLLERGHLDGAPMRTIRTVVRALDASVELDVRWRGGAIDRLLDERHAALEAATMVLIAPLSWAAAPEVSYSEYGERGAVDVLAWRMDAAAALVVEVKSELASVEATLRKHDEKVRLAPRLVRQRAGWTPRIVGRILVLPESRTARRHLERAGPMLDANYPLRSRELRAWLRAPVGSVGGVLLLTDTTGRSASRRIVRPPRNGPARDDRPQPSSTILAGA